MTVLLVSLMAPSAPTGVVTHYTALRDELVRRGHAVTLVTPANAPRAARITTGMLRRVRAWLGRERAVLAATQRDAARVHAACRYAAVRPDVIHAHDPISGYAAGECYAWTIPVVTTCHFNESPLAEIRRQTGLESSATPHLQRWLERRLQALGVCIAVSHDCRRQLATLSADHADIRVVHNGVDFDALASVPAARDPAVHHKNALTVINAGHLEPRKNQRLLLQVASCMKPDPVSFVLAGDGPDRASLEHEADLLGVRERVTFVGQRHDIPGLLKTADLYVQTSTMENCPIVLLEAIACGLPVLASKVGGTAELFPGTESDSLFEADTPPETLAARIRERLADRAGLRTLQARQREAIREEFSLARMDDQIEDCYRAVLTPT